MYEVKCCNDRSIREFCSAIVLVGFVCRVKTVVDRCKGNKQTIHDLVLDRTQFGGGIGFLVLFMFH